jgi:glycosyltransferase involved in cell wall biosynthesis
MNPRISIVVPNFNGARYLPACLESILGQHYKNLELLVIDGGSRDESAAVVRECGSAVDVFVSETDAGQSEAINKGLARATGEIVAYVNSDDISEPGSLERVGRFFKTNPRAEWLAGGCRVFGELIKDWYLHPSGWERLIDTVLPWARQQRYVFPQSGACFMRRTLVQELGPYDTRLHYSMDMEYYARAAFRGVTMEVVPDVLAGWRLHSESKSWTRGLAYAFRKDEVEILRRYMSELPTGERRIAEASLFAESQLVVIREANYWARNGQRLRGLQMLLSLITDSPSWILHRMWLGGVRRALVGWETPGRWQS